MRISIIIPIKGRGFINHGSTLITDDIATALQQFLLLRPPGAEGKSASFSLRALETCPNSPSAEFGNALHSIKVVQG